MSHIVYCGQNPDGVCSVCHSNLSVKYVNKTTGKFYCNKCALTQNLRDAALEKLWLEFGDVPMNPETECIEQDWHNFPAGTHREEIWHWFDGLHSCGVYYLLYEMEG